MLQTFAVDQRFIQIFSNGEAAMLAKKNCVVIVNEGPDGFRILMGGWGGIRRDWNIPKRECYFRQDIMWKRLIRNSKRGGVDRMGVDYGVNLGPLFIHLKVHWHFRRRLETFPRNDDISVQVNHE